MFDFMKKSQVEDEVLDAEFEDVPENETEEEPKSKLKRNILIGAGILGAVVTTAIGIGSAQKRRQAALDAMMFRDMDDSEEGEEDEDETEDSEETETDSE